MYDRFWCKHAGRRFFETFLTLAQLSADGCLRRAVEAVEGFEEDEAEAAAAAAAADLTKPAFAAQPIAPLHTTVDTSHHEQNKTLLFLQPSLALASSFLSRWVNGAVFSSHVLSLLKGHVRGVVHDITGLKAMFPAAALNSGEGPFYYAQRAILINLLVHCKAPWSLPWSCEPHGSKACFGVLSTLLG
jgi:hypothetical protein